ncbi:hypothetical protein B0H14DRAFT_3890662 [Mycena olivaceomarginata]|nr:hypothetical protein B0H14DRAFT_3890662 [Mycena olivaceomarginata]
MDPAVSLNLYTTIGAFLIGVLVSYVLVGVLTAQTYIYYGRFPDDSPKLKALVAFVWVCEIIHGLCIGHGLYVYTICDYWHPDRIFGGPSPPSMDTAVLFCAIIATCVQGFYGSRIYTFSGNLYIPILIWIMASLRLLAGFGNLISGLRMASLADHNRHWLWLSGFGWSISAATDLTIAATLVFHLHQQRKKVDKSSRTAALVDKLILWTIETGALTSLSSIVALACFITMRHNFIYLAFFTLEATMFSNSLLARTDSTRIWATKALRTAARHAGASYKYSSLTEVGGVGAGEYVIEDAAEDGLERLKSRLFSLARVVQLLYGLPCHTSGGLALRHTVPYMDPAASFNPHTTIGAFLIGVLVSYVLVGVVTAQTYIYYCRFPDDSSKLKALVAFVWLCDIIHGLCIGHGLYVYTICDYRYPDRIFGGPSPSVGTAILFCAIISTCEKLYIPILIWIMTFLRLLAGFGCLISGLRMASLVALHKQRLWLSEVAWSISAATDLTIAATLVFHLHQQRKKVNKSSRTAALVDKLILWTIETGGTDESDQYCRADMCMFHPVRTLFAPEYFLQFITMGYNFIFLVFLTLEAQMFSNSLLASLNSRETLREMNEHEISLKISLPAMSTTPALSTVKGPHGMDPAFSFDPDSTIGAYQIGVLISYVLFGVTTTQA